MVEQNNTNNDQMMDQVARKIEAANNVLVAVSVNPTVDEIAAALGLTLLLDNMGKHATAIYSGETPNALEFLKPDETFESDVNSLQDFIIALDKEKADHLRYKIDGPYVKVYITPYRASITEKDLIFSRGDFNVDLVIALNVKDTEDLDNVLREHGRIMHDASVINVTNSEPGKLGELEWCDQSASSVSEMVANYAVKLKDANLITRQASTALMTGIVAATERFSNQKTSPKTMALASRLMAAGADQQLISANITAENLQILRPNTQTVVEQAAEPVVEEKSEEVVLSRDEIKQSVEPAEPVAEQLAEPVIEEKPVEGPVAEEKAIEAPVVEEPKSDIGTETPVAEELKSDIGTETPVVDEPKSDTEVASGLEEPTLSEDLFNEINNIPSTIGEIEAESAPVVVATDEGIKNYSKMVEDALADENTTEPKPTGSFMGNPLGENPASNVVPDVGNEKVDALPEMSYNNAPSTGEESFLAGSQPKVVEPLSPEKVETQLPMPEDGILPPPPTPTVDFDQMMPNVEANSVSEPAADLSAVSEPTSDDVSQPGAFKIPGM